jgi:hypothetical protein
MVTIREYLQKPNPALVIDTVTTQSTDQVGWEPVEEYEIFDDFNVELLQALYGDVLDHEFDAKELPTPSKLLPIEHTIRSERELEQDPLKRSIIPKVNYAIVAAYKYINKKDAGNTFMYPPATVCGTKLSSGALYLIGYSTNKASTNRLHVAKPNCRPYSEWRGRLTRPTGGSTHRLNNVYIIVSSTKQDMGS